MVDKDVLTRDVEEGVGDHATTISSNGYINTALPARILLQPLAAPSILGYFGLAAASLVIGAHAAGWYGNGSTPLYMLTFVAVFGGLAQFLAGMWAYRARDALATAVHGTWGAFFGAYGLLYLLVADGTLSLAAVNQNYGFGYIALAAITGVCMFAALAENVALAGTLVVLTITAVIAAIGTLVGDASWLKAGGYAFLVAALCAWYLGSALLLEGSWRRVMLPLGRMHGGTNRPGSIATEPVEYALGEPGVRMGQ